MGIVRFFRDLFGEKEKINLKDCQHSEEQRMLIDAYALFTAIDMAAALAANCEYKTYNDGKEVKGPLWVMLNYKPNKNQSATEFWIEAYSKLMYEGELLFVQPTPDQFIIADYFSKEEHAVREQIFSDVTRGDYNIGGTFRMSEVLYLKYKNNGIEMMKSGMLSDYNRIAGAAVSAFTEHSGNRGTLEIPGAARSAIGQDFDKVYKELMDERFKSFFKARNSVIPLWGGMRYIPVNNQISGTEITDMIKVVDDALCRAAQAVRISPALLKGDIAGIKEALDLTLTTSTDILANAMSEQLTTKLFSTEDISRDCFIKADTSNIKHIDIFSIATSFDKLISSGFSHDELRSSAGLVPTGEEWAQEHYITKNYEQVDGKTKDGGKEK